MHHRAPLLCLSVLAIAALLSSAAHSQTYAPFSAGTGFAINKDGDIITNYHVVDDCKTMTVLTKNGEIPATLSAYNKEIDIAVIRAPKLNPQEMADLSFDPKDIKVGNSVFLIGFPGHEGVINRAPTFKKTTIAHLRLYKNERTIQLTSVAKPGNSGSPILDAAGNVIGVVKGIVIFKSGTRLAVTKSGGLSAVPPPKESFDIGVTLLNTKDFLIRNSIRYRERLSAEMEYSDDFIHNRALKFTFSVRCMHG